MKFKDFDTQMRLHETMVDANVPEGQYYIVRLDGRGFTKLTKEIIDFERPFDTRFHLLMEAVAHYLMQHSGFNICAAYIQSDEISLLIDKTDKTFNRLNRKILSTLAALAASAFSVKIIQRFTPNYFKSLFEVIVSFDARLSLHTDNSSVIDYFSWRSADSVRNSLNSYCYWKLRDIQNLSANQATKRLDKLSVADKKALLSNMNIDFDHIPDWQRYGSLLTWYTDTNDGHDPITGEDVHVLRRYIKGDYPKSTEDMRNRIAAVVAEI